MKTTIEKNRMLLDFMGEKPRMIGPDDYVWNDSPFFYCREDNPEKVMDAVAEYIPYNSDWNRLIQVVGKCLESGDNTDKWDEIFNALSTVNKNTVYEAVVEFVEWYNQNIKS